MADATLSRIERNRLSPSVALTKRIADALGLPLDALVGHKVPKAHRNALRPSEARLLALVRDLDDTAVEDIARALKSLLTMAKRTRRSEHP